MIFVFCMLVLATLVALLCCGMSIINDDAYGFVIDGVFGLLLLIATIIVAVYIW